MGRPTLWMQKPQVAVHLQAQVKLHWWTQAASGELSGLGKVSEVCNGGGTLIGVELLDVVLLPQESSSSHTKLGPCGLARFLAEQEAKLQDASAWRLWWHSHGELGCFWSSTDEDTIAELLGNQPLVSLVVNKWGHRRFRLDLRRPVSLTADRLPYTVRYPDDELRKACFAEVAEKVSGAEGSGGEDKIVQGALPLLPAKRSPRPRQVMPSFRLTPAGYGLGLGLMQWMRQGTCPAGVS